MAENLEIAWESLTPLSQRKDDYSPTPQEIAGYAEYLGFEWPRDAAYEAVFREALQASLPNGWQPCETPDGEMVYRNLTTKVVSYAHPLDDVYRNKVLKLKELAAGLTISAIQEESGIRDSSLQDSSLKMEGSNLPVSEALAINDISQELTEQVVSGTDSVSYESSEASASRSPSQAASTIRSHRVYSRNNRAKKAGFIPQPQAQPSKISLNFIAEDHDKLRYEKEDTSLE